MNTQQEIIPTATPEHTKHCNNSAQRGINYKETIRITTAHLWLQPQPNIFGVFPKKEENHVTHVMTVSMLTEIATQRIATDKI